MLEQLEECPSSGDELLSPKKRLKLDLEGGIANDVIIEANRDHRKVTEVRRLSDVSIKHHRRPSADGKHRDLGHERSSYMPHAVCKRRKTGGSDSGSRIHHYEHSGSESVSGSRPGTPLCDERPEHFTPTEPRRIPREREGPLSLPLPRFAAQVMNRGSVSVAGIKGQKDNVLSSPPPAVTSPRIANPKPPSPAQVPPPASPPPRPPSLSSNSSDSDVAPPSPSLDERIRSLDEKYEKWSGSRAISAAGSEALAKLDATREKFKFRHKLLDMDLKEVQPSEIVKSVMAKRSVFDEDSKRLENVGEKYEPREFNLFPRTTALQCSASPIPAPPLLKIVTTPQLPKTPTTLSPRSTSGTSLIPAKGLQYPFPSHPPASSSTSPSCSAATSTTTTTAAAAATITAPRLGAATHGDNRLKPCTSATAVALSDRTPSKINVNRTVVGSGSVVVVKSSDKNIPSTNNNVNNSDTCSTILNTNSENGKPAKGPVNNKIIGRRDSSSNSSSSPRTSSRRNSDTGIRVNKTDDENEDGGERERLEKHRFDQIRIDHEKMEREKQEKERMEKERLEKERLELEK